MKICFLAHAASIHTRRWMNFFRDHGHDVSIITLTPTEPLHGINVHVLQNSISISYQRANWRYLFKLPQLYKTIRNIQPDIINAHFLSSYGFLGALTKPPNTPFIISLHGSDIMLFPKRSLLHRKMTRFALNNADMITSVAQHMTNELTLYGAAEKPTLTLQYGVDTKKFHPPASKLKQPVCISNRAMVPLSNLDTILLAAHKLKKRNSRIHFHIIGDGELSSELHEQAESLNLEGIVTFLGKIEHAKMANFLRKSAIYISMTASDGASLSLLEAMACGSFPIVSDIPANREWIQDGVNGYLITPTSAEELAEKITAAWQKPELRLAAANHNWSLIQEKGSYQKNMHIVKIAFEKLVEKKCDSDIERTTVSPTTLQA